MRQSSTTRLPKRSRTLTWRISPTLHERGYLLAGGPLDDPELRGLSIYSVDPEKVRELRAQDPAVIAGRLSIKVIPWRVPRGAVHFTPTSFPRSL